MNWIFLKKMKLNNPLNWILPWNEWMNHILNRYLPFLMKSPLFCLFWTLFGQFSGTFPIRPVSKSPWLLNWIIFWIESAEFFLNWIIFWIESWVKRYWIEYWMNHFLAKFKHWIESDRVSNTPSWKRPLLQGGNDAKLRLVQLRCNWTCREKHPITASFEVPELFSSFDL